MKFHVIDDWLNSLEEANFEMNAGQPDAPGGPPVTDPYMGSMANAGQPSAETPEQQQANDPNITNQIGNEPENVNDDPAVPDMPEEQPKVADFEKWRNDYLKESVRGDTQKLTDMLHNVRDREGLKSIQRKFIEDNWNIQLLRQNANIEKVSKDIRRNIKDQLDRNNPATTVANHMVSVLDTDPNLNNIFIKLTGYNGIKGDLHRKFIGALLGGVQVGSGANSEDLIYNEKDYSILISTRFNADWGDVMLGSWYLHQDDADRYLAEPEKQRLQDGSPEEKDVLRRRILLESITHQFETRAFIINVVSEDGTVHTLGWDLASSLKAAYADGSAIVKIKVNESSESMITEEGQIVPFMDLDIFYGKETGEHNEDGTPEREELPFIERKNGMLFLTADLNTLKEASNAMQGMVLKESPYNGNPSDLKVLARCTYSAHDLLLRTC